MKRWIQAGTGLKRSHDAYRNGIQLAACSSNGELHMAEKATMKRARRDKRAGKAATTQAGEFVREEIHHVRAGKHGARSTKQAIAIGLSKARRAGVKLGKPPKSAKAKTRRSAAYASQAGRRGRRKTSPTRSRAVRSALRREPRRSVS